jgi:hypothetical protein
MTPEQREAALRLAEFESLPRKLLDIACRVRVNECLFHDDEFVDDASHTLKEALALLRELAAEPVQAPVAWMAESKSGSVRFTNIGQSADELESLGWAIVPLYAAPQQPMRCPTDGGECGAGGYCRPEQRKPLTRDELLSLWKQHGYKSAMCEPFARAVEEAHGIGETP